MLCKVPQRRNVEPFWRKSEPLRLDVRPWRLNIPPKRLNFPPLRLNIHPLRRRVEPQRRKSHPQRLKIRVILQVRAARELHEREARAADDYLVGAYGGRRFEAVAPGGGDDVVLINAVAADADAADELAVLVDGDAARKDLDAVRDVRNRRAAHVRAADGREQVRLDEVNL